MSIRKEPPFRLRGGGWFGEESKSIHDQARAILLLEFSILGDCDQDVIASEVEEMFKVPVANKRNFRRARREVLQSLASRGCDISRLSRLPNEEEKEFFDRIALLKRDLFFDSDNVEDRFDQTVRQIVALNGIAIERKFRAVLAESLRKATIQQPLRIFVGSCPDYSYRDGLYTHEGLGSGVPLLTLVHLEEGAGILKVLDNGGIPFEYVIMLADVEATDRVFCNKFSNGSEEEFLVKCAQSVEVTSRELSKPEYYYKHGSLRASSFFLSLEGNHSCGCRLNIKMF